MTPVKIQYSASSVNRTSGPDQLKKPLFISATGHGVFLIAALWGAVSGHGSSVWGEASTGSAASVSLVSAASIPLPAPSKPTTNKLANEEPGLHQSEAPKPAPKPVVEKAIELPDPKARKPVTKAPPKKAPPRQEARLHKPDREIPPGNEIPFGAGGPAQGPYGSFQNDAGVGGFGFDPSAGDFGARYGWYVTAMRNRISSNWLRGTVDPNVRAAPRVYVSFDILRDGRVVTAQITQSSGIPSLDRSALRAVYDSNPMPPLPPDYRNSRVAVEFWFDFRR